MKILYFWDAYCGWCYGFNKLFTEFYKNHTDIEIEIVSGGLYILENSNKISKYTFKNEEIVEMYKVEFGEAYNKVVEEGELVLNSVQPAIALNTVKELIPNSKLLDFAYDIQKKFFIEGKSLSEVGTYLELCEKYDLDYSDLALKLTIAFKDTNPIQQDFLKTLNLGIESYPTAVIEKNGEYFDLVGYATEAEDIEIHYNLIAKKL
ncbi:thioredoxin [uncultured Gemella sp.]|uniref:DsbA family protein n=1 Tax=uncultured Gemella sp. TaxID=254352 RepID=UPI0028D43143|nr:thioredoxin [uncultured Gemella sp.]